MKLMVLGAGYAGVTAALRLARETSGRASVTLVNAHDQFVERIRLHELAAGRPSVSRPLADLLRGAGVELRVGTVRAIDLEHRTLQLGAESLRWDRLVLALGSHVDLDTVPGVREYAFSLDPQRAKVFAGRIPQLSAAEATLAIVGGGLSGVEAASELAAAWPGLRILLLSSGPLGEGLSKRASSHMHRQLTAAGVDVREGVRVLRVTEGALETDHGSIECDACLWAGGFRAPALAAEAGFAVDGLGRVLVDAECRSRSHPDVYVAGDVAALAPELGPAWPMGCKTAGPTGAHVADNLARELDGKAARPFDFRPPAFCLSLGRRDGVFQLVARDGTYTGAVVTGRPASWIKEFICKATVWILQFELKRSARGAEASEPATVAARS